MNKSHIIAGWLFAGIFLVFSLGGCAWFDRFFGEDVEKSPAELMNDGMENIERGRYSAATEGLRSRWPIPFTKGIFMMRPLTPMMNLKGYTQKIQILLM
jgi:hypothetical protein